EERITEAATRSGRNADAVRLVGVSKGNPPELVVEAVAAGLKEIGENRIQEAAGKIPAVASRVDTHPSWHLVGHLQANKAPAALDLFATIQSVDSLRVPQALSRLAAPELPVFLAIQYGRTRDRFGFDPTELGEAYD